MFYLQCDISDVGSIYSELSLMYVLFTVNYLDVCSIYSVLSLMYVLFTVNYL